MTAPSERWIQVVVPPTEATDAEARKMNVRLPSHADLRDLLEALKEESMPIYEEVRKRVLRLSGDVLAYGVDQTGLVQLRDQLKRGGPIVIPDPSSSDIPT